VEYIPLDAALEKIKVEEGLSSYSHKIGFASGAVSAQGHFDKNFGDDSIKSSKEEKSLNDIFKMTNAVPPIYYLPLSEKQIQDRKSVSQV
jgi:hypothetical protein